MTCLIKLTRAANTIDKDAIMWLQRNCAPWGEDTFIYRGEKKDIPEGNWCEILGQRFLGEAVGFGLGLPKQSIVEPTSKKEV